MLIEVIACSVADAVAAERGGAGRLELVRALDRGGLTPPLEFVEEVVDAVKIPVRAMIRENDGYETGEAADVDGLVDTAGRFGALGIDGVVLGFLHGGRIDAGAMNAVLSAVRSTHATFHHAFDALPDALAAIEALRAWPQIDRVLTSGGGGSWSQKAARIRAWSGAAAPDIGLLAGGGVDLAAVRTLARSGVAEAHVGRAARLPPTADGPVSRQKVAELVEAACR